MFQPSKRIVLIAPTWLGDAVMSLPLVGYLAAAEGVRLTVVARERSARVYAGIDEVPDLVVCSDSSRRERIGAPRRILRRIRADGAVVLPPSFSAALAPFLAGVKVRVGVRSDGRAVLLNASIPGKGLREVHLSATYLRLGRVLLEGLGVPVGHDFAAARPAVYDTDRRTIGERLAREGVENGYVVVVPGATYGETKTWPREKYREVVGAMSREIRVILGGSPGERGLCDSVGKGFFGVLNLAGQTTLGEFMALLEGARCLIANDSGAPHLAAALGVPVAVIFGSTSPAWTSPLGDSVHVVREAVHCSPCFRKRCPTKLECYDAISADRVLEIGLRAARAGGEKKVSRRLPR
jgi:heptosyltransferase-2